MKFNSKTELMFSSKFSWVELLELPECSFIVIFIMTTVSLSGIPTLVDTVWDAARIIVNKFNKKEVFMSFIASFMRRIKYQSDLLDQLVTRYLARGISIRRGGWGKNFPFPISTEFNYFLFISFLMAWNVYFSTKAKSGQITEIFIPFRSGGICGILWPGDSLQTSILIRFLPILMMMHFWL